MLRRTALLTTTVLLAGAVGLIVSGLPPRAPARAAAGEAVPGVIRFAYHVHTNRSDGSGSVDDVAAAAAQAGLQAVIVTDHGDGTAHRLPPAYRHGVLVIDAEEIATDAGHVVALGLPPSPYPLAGAPRAVVDDIRHLGGLPVVAHPGSAQPALRWRDWDAPMAGLEWLNLDSEWRDDRLRLASALLSFPIRPVETIASLIDRPAFVLTQWDRLTERRAVVAIGAHDAHARVGVGSHDGPISVLDVRQPSYASAFRAFSNRAVLGAPLSGDAGMDAQAVLAAVASGHVYSVVDGWWPGGRFTMTATAGSATAGMGERLDAAGPVRVEVDGDVPPQASTVLLCRGREVMRASGGRLTWAGGPAPGACRIEVRVPGPTTERAWLVSNPVYLQPAPPAPVVDRATAWPDAVEVRGSDLASSWTLETGGGATGQVSDDRSGPDPAVRFAWHLPSQATGSPFAAMRLTAPKELKATGIARLIVRAEAARATRIWLQWRASGPRDRRWGRSVAVRPGGPTIEVPLSEFLPLSADTPTDVPWQDVDALLLVVDRVNSRPGDAGAVSMKALWLAP